MSRLHAFGLIALCGLMVLAGAGPAGGQGYDPASPWPAMRHDYLNTGRADEVSPSRLPAGERARMWEFQTNGPIFSTPVVGADDTVYIGSADFIFYAIGADGNLKWSFPTGRLIDSAAALSADGRIYVPGGDGSLYALEAATGRELWRFSARNLRPDRVEMTNWFEGNVSLGPDGRVLAGNDDFCLYGLDPDGSLQLESCVGGMIWSAVPTDPAGRRFFCSLDMSCYGLDASGEQRWKKGTWGVVSASPAVGPDGTVYVTSFDGKVYALDPATGRQRWAFLTGDHLYGSAAIAADGTLYIGGCDGTMYALRDQGDRAELKWAYDTLDPIRSSPVLDGDGNIYFGDGDGNVFVLSPEGQRRWSINLTRTDKNDVNASIALGRRAFYVAMQDGRVIQIPYDYCLWEENAGDPRCQLDPGEELPFEGASVYWMTPGGSSRPTDRVIPGVLPGNVLTLRLVVRERGETAFAGIDRDSLRVEIEPWFPHHLSVSMDHRFLNIVPEQAMEPGTEYRLRISGSYRRPGLKLLGHIWLSEGKRLGRFEAELRFRTEELPALSPSRPQPLLLTHLSFYQPMIFPSVAQIGMDDLIFMVAPIQPGPDKQWIAWAMLAWPDKSGGYRVVPGNRVTFPARLSIHRGLVLMESRDFAFDHAGDRFGWNLFRLSGTVEEAGEEEKISRNSLYAEGKSLSMAGSFYDVPAFGTPLAGTLTINHINLPEQDPAGFSVKRVYRKGNKVAAQYDNAAGLITADHHLGILLIDEKSGEPLVLDYPRVTVQASDSAGRAISTEIRLPLKYLLAPGRDLLAVVILDGRVLKKQKL